MDVVLSRLEEFEAEKQIMKYDNNTKMNALESKIMNLENELSKAHRMSIGEKDETISQL